MISLWDFAIFLVSSFKLQLAKDFDDDIVSLSEYKAYCFLCDDFLNYVFKSLNEVSIL